MPALVIYESMYGNTRKVAMAIAEGLSDGADVSTARVGTVTAAEVAAADLVVVGGPTHGWSMSRPATRRGAADAVHKPKGTGLVVEDGAEGIGLREWIDGLPAHGGSKLFATFDTRRRVPLGLSGSAARAAKRRLSRLGWSSVRQPEPFYVTKADQLEPGELARARAWGAALVASAG
jgi:hypothetical protein